MSLYHQPTTDAPWDLPNGARDIVKSIAAEQILHEMLADKLEHAHDLEEDALEDLVINYPGVCQRKFSFDPKEGRKARMFYPLSMLLHLNPPLHTVETFARAYPKALDEQNPLMIACKHNASLDVVKFLLTEIPNAIHEPMAKLNVYPLHWSCRKGNPEVVQHLLDEYPEATREADRGSGCLPLHIAVAYGVPLDVIKSLYHAWPQAALERDNNGWVPLHHACRFPRDLEVVKFLVQVTPDADLVRESLAYAASHQSIDVIEFLMQKNEQLQNPNGEDETLLARAVTNNTADVVDFLAKQYPWMLTTPDREAGRIPLHNAIQYEASADVVGVLIRHDPTTLICRDVNEETPLDVARLTCADDKVVEMLETVSKNLDHFAAL
eukprot:CAMPEP_0172464762 /NCGR_PEP_ID=MMETSP1065-20121228/51499_1 /TAXON_ID=265537 /ORGANISM="Amphiprora paludosa, Strain CCMP125" /LENGTH=380 /DNA_ID=CAMNT_0013221099 /DNA_START=298 /DNA_END=1440 /DNA_ORIENTATION=+